MKTPFCTLFCFATFLGTGLADEVAVLDIKNSGDKNLHRVIIEFYDHAAPATVANFKKLASAKFYDHTAFHRVFPHRMVQAGDPLSRNKNSAAIGTGGPGYTLPPEINSHKQLNGTVSTARLPDKINPGRVSNGSQFFITLAPAPDLDGQYTVFGHVIEGLDVIDSISQKPADTNDSPVERVEVESAQIVPREAAATVKPRTGGGVGEFFRRLF
jgi:peptidyl-prolyl cis-trans isomerase B (cyclophilin B)